MHRRKTRSANFSSSKLRTGPRPRGRQWRTCFVHGMSICQASWFLQRRPRLIKLMSNLAIFGQVRFCPILVMTHLVHAEPGEFHSMWLVLSGPSWTIIHSQYHARCHAAPVPLRDVSQIFHIFRVIFKVIWAVMCLSTDFTETPWLVMIVSWKCGE